MLWQQNSLDWLTK